MVLLSVLAAVLCFDQGVEGVVVNEEGKPFPQARVMMQTLNGQLYSYSETTSDPSGKFRFPTAPKTFTSFAVAVPGYAVGLGRWDSDKTVKLVVHRPAAQKIRVLDGAGKPVPNLELVDLFVQEHRDGQWASWVADRSHRTLSATTDKDGFATLDGLDGKQSILLGTSDIRFAAQLGTKSFRIGESPLVELVARPGCQIKGRVTYQGRGVPGVLVGANPVDRDLDGEEEITGPDGSYTLSQLKVGVYDVMVSPNKDLPPGIAATARKGVHLDSEASLLVDFAMEPAGLLKVHVINQKGRPLAGASVFVGGPGGPISAAYFIARTQSDGLVRVQVPPGRQTVQLQFDATLVHREVDVKPGQVTEIELAAEEQKKTPQSVVVVDPFAKAVEAEVILVAGENMVGARVDSKGKGIFEVTFPGPYQVWAKTANGWGVKQLDKLTQDPVLVEVKKAEFVSARGQVVDDSGRPVAGAQVSARYDGAKAPPFRPASRTDDNGNFTFENIFPGTQIVLFAVAPDCGPKDPWIPQPVQKELPVFHLNRLDQTVTGRVIGPDGKPVASAEIEGPRAMRRHAVITAEDGTFTYKGMPKGGAFLRATKGDWEASLQVTDVTKPVEIRLEDNTKRNTLLRNQPGLIELGAPAPEFKASGTWINSSPFTLASLKGKVVILQFWGTWCGPCVAEIPDLVKLRAELPIDKVVLVGVHTFAIEPAKLIQFSRKQNLTWPVFVDADYEGQAWATSYVYGIRGWPTLVVLDKDGKVVHISHEVDLARDAVRNLLKNS